MNNNYMYGVERSEEYLAHYGIRGMRWGVHKAIKSGNSAKLSKQYAKASKKLAKLEKRATKTGKYARRAALMGAGAAAAGGLAAAGTAGVGSFMKNNAKYAGQAVRGAGSAMVGAGQVASKLTRGKVGGKLIGAGYGLQSKGIKSANVVYNAGNAVDVWGRGNSIGKKAGATMYKHLNSKAAPGLNKALIKTTGNNVAGLEQKLGRVSNNTIARVGAGVVGAGLAAGAAKNAYRAATAKKKAAKFKSEMNKAFAGTKYANGGNRQGKKRRK